MADDQSWPYLLALRWYLRTIAKALSPLRLAFSETVQYDKVLLTEGTMQNSIGM
jgi:hypothetical protein